MTETASLLTGVGPDSVDAGWRPVGAGEPSAPEEQAANNNAMAGTASQDNRQHAALVDTLKGQTSNNSIKKDGYEDDTDERERMD